MWAWLSQLKVGLDSVGRLLIACRCGRGIVSECKLAVDYKKEAGFKWIKRWKNLIFHWKIQS